MSQADSQQRTGASKFRSHARHQDHALLCEHDQLRALRRRLETAAEALSKHSNQLKAQAFQGGHCHHARNHDDAAESDPDGGKP